MRWRDAKSSARIQGIDGANAARMRDRLSVCLRFSGEAPEKLRDSGSMANG